MPQTILIVDDEKRLVSLVESYLIQEGYRVVTAFNGKEALAVADKQKPDLIILDIMMPEMNGYDFMRVHRAEHDTPIIMLTAKVEDDDKVIGLELGADDYVVKPFKPRELIARVRARLRRSGDSAPPVIHIGDLDIDVTGHRVTRQGEAIPLTPLEFDVLVALARSPGQVFTREVLLEDVWGYRHAADTRLVNVHIQRLRAKIEKDPENPEIILTVRGVGYKAGGPGA
jgi:two-component system, OmpR family, response regulator MtrA